MEVSAFLSQPEHDAVDWSKHDWNQDVATLYENRWGLSRKCRNPVKEQHYSLDCINKKKVKARHPIEVYIQKYLTPFERCYNI